MRGLALTGLHVMPASLRIVLPARRESLEPARLAVLDYLDAARLAPTAVYRIELVLEEVLMNIVWHAYPAGDQHAMTIEAQLAGEDVVLAFEDQGEAFDPTAAAEPVPPRRLDEARAGGLGLSLVRKFAREIAYERRGDTNRLRVVIAAA